MVGERVDYYHKVYGAIDAFIVTVDGVFGATLRIPQIGQGDVIKKGVARGRDPGQWERRNV